MLADLYLPRLAPRPWKAFLWSETITYHNQSVFLQVQSLIQSMIDNVSMGDHVCEVHWPASAHTWAVPRMGKLKKYNQLLKMQESEIIYMTCTSQRLWATWMSIEKSYHFPRKLLERKTSHRHRINSFPLNLVEDFCIWWMAREKYELILDNGLKKQQSELQVADQKQKKVSCK